MQRNPHIFYVPPPPFPGHAGACLGTGIERGKVGDILVTGEQGAQILCSPNLVEHLEAALTQASGAGQAGALLGVSARLCWQGKVTGCLREAKARLPDLIMDRQAPTDREACTRARAGRFPACQPVTACPAAGLSLPGATFCCLSQVRTVPVQTQGISLSELQVRPHALPDAAVVLLWQHLHFGLLPSAFLLPCP